MLPTYYRRLELCRPGENCDPPYHISGKRLKNKTLPFVEVCWGEETPMLLVEEPRLETPGIRSKVPPVDPQSSVQALDEL
ncbi:hypothetical protein BTVI_50592 [Pitangus sulphuratus]|nr:hypothetical protein BTVI_50592 [Pitangus sulphuratus]